MMRGFCAVTLLVLTFATISPMVHGQCDDAYDNVICVTKIDSAAGAQFNAHDGSLTPFWSTIGGDYFELTPDNSQYCHESVCGFTGPHDGKMYVKLAATHACLYVYVEVQDNVWVDWTDPGSYGDDSVMLFFDELTGDEVWNCSDCHAAPYGARMSYTTEYFLVFMGGADIPDELRAGYYDMATYTFVYQGDQGIFTRDEALEKWGLEVEVIETDATHKVQEWRFPWTMIGEGGITPGTDISGRLFAFCAGYNDKDGDNEQPHKLRWPGPQDPWFPDAETNQWGNFVVPSGMVVTEPGDPVPPPPPPPPPDPSTRKTVIRATKLDSATAATFSATDGSLSSFWTSVTEDTIHLVPEDNRTCYDTSGRLCGFTDSTDAALHVKVAASRSDLYIYAEARDNSWATWSDPARYGDDSFTIFLDEKTADSVWNCPSCHTAPSGARMSNTSRQFLAFMRSVTMPDKLKVRRYDPNRYAWVYGGAEDVVSFSDARVRYGLELEVVQLGANRTAQEWRLSWAGLGSGLTEGTELSNRRVAFCVGYNDIDQGDSSPDWLRWPGPRDPWLTDSRLQSAAGNQWGDILLPADLGTVDIDGIVGSKIARAAPGRIQSPYASVDLFTLTGRRIRAEQVERTHGTAGVMVQRRVMHDGRVVVERVPGVR
jgi:Zn-finger protein